MVVGNAPAERNDHRDSMVGNLLKAIIRNVGDSTAQFAGAGDINVVDSDSVAHDALHLRKRLEHAPSDGRPLHEQHVNTCAALYYLIVGLANGLYLAKLKSR